MQNPIPFPSVPLSTSRILATIWSFLPRLEAGSETTTDGTGTLEHVGYDHNILNLFGLGSV